MKKKLITVVCLFFVVSALWSQTDRYKVYALKFKHIGRASAVGSVNGATSNDSIDVCYMIWFLKGNNGHNILIDTGDLDSLEQGKKEYIRPDKLLKDIDINVSDITDIIITHPHFDHINGLPLFNHGTVWMQRKDFDDFVVDAWRRNKPAGFRKDDVRNLINVSLEGRLKLVEGDDVEIIPGVKVFTGSTHTKENQYVLVTSEENNKIILASDAIWFYLNFWRMAPIEEYVENPHSYVDAMKRMKTMVNNDKFIIPGHDNLVFSQFEHLTSRVAVIK